MSIFCALTAALAANAEPRISKNGKNWVRLRAVIGDGDDRAFLTVSCFGDVAAESATLVKGDVISVEGAIKLSRWKAQDGTEKSELSVTARYLRRVEIGLTPIAPREKGTEMVFSAASNEAARFVEDSEIPF